MTCPVFVAVDENKGSLREIEAELRDCCGLQTMCEGGGQANVTTVELL